MRTVEWAARAEMQLAGWIDYLAAEATDALAKEANYDVRAKSDRLGKRPFDHRLSRWPGYREMSLIRWRKIAVYQVLDDKVVVVAFYDARQDLSIAAPETD